MGGDQVVELLKSYMDFNDGVDYYAYWVTPHWYIGDEDLPQLAQELIDRIGMNNNDKPAKGVRPFMEVSDWKRFEELVYQAGGVSHEFQLKGKLVGDEIQQAAHAMSFHTLGLAILDLLARLNISTDKPERSSIIVPNDYTT